MQIKTTVRYHLISIKTATKKTRNKCWQGSEEKRTLVHTLLVGKHIGSDMENNMEVPQKLNN